MAKFKSGPWDFEYNMHAKGGLVLSNIKHGPYNLAKDIRVVRIRINPEDEEGSPWTKSFYLGTDDFYDKTAGNYLRAVNLNAPPPFDIYTKANTLYPSGLQAIYETKEKVFGNEFDNDDGILTIKQTYIFTPYGLNPPHEPAAVLPATRIFPLIEFSYSGKRVKTIRIDYRFNNSLDFFLFDRAGNSFIDPFLENTNMTQSDINKIKQDRPNMAGVFRDNEGSPNRPNSLKSIFSAYEKPVQYEMCGYGLIKGYTGEVVESDILDKNDTMSDGEDIIQRATNKITWDNYHQWGAYKDFKKYPSTPGAFHSFHLHWRWNYLAQHPDVIDKGKVAVGSILITPTNPGTGAVGSPQMVGYPTQSGRGGALLDFKIPNQTIRFSITKTKPPLQINGKNDQWDAESNPSERNFESLFYNPIDETPKPREIKDGDDLLFWISFEVHNTPMEDLSSRIADITVDEETSMANPFQGTVFIHGFYFAHNIEDYLSNAFKFTIDKNGNYPERTSYRWHRDAE
ncbi:MAG: hypothetical protein ABIQ40_13455 [Bacteroidia bacterium]